MPQTGPDPDRKCSTNGDTARFFGTSPVESRLHHPTPPVQDKIDRTGNFGGGEGKSMVSALARIEDRLAILLDVHALVSDSDLKMPDLG